MERITGGALSTGFDGKTRVTGEAEADSTVCAEIEQV